MEPEQAAVRTVGAALGDDAHHRSRGAAELGQKLIRDETDFGDDVRIVHRLQHAAGADVIGILPVDQVAVGAHPHAVDGVVQVAGLGALVAAAHEAGIAARNLRHTGNGGRQVQDVAVGGERQIGHALGIEVRADLGAGGIDQRRIGAHRDRLRGPADGERDVQVGLLVKREAERALPVTAEARLVDGHVIGADRQERYAEGAGLGRRWSP